jgi:hypothetical protein
MTAALPLPGCQHAAAPQPSAEVVVAPQRGGPPPHAPAHGYRRKQRSGARELELVFDSGLGVYVVVGFPGVYFHLDHYFRLAGSTWQVSLRPDAGWDAAAQSQVPPGLRHAKHGAARKGGPPGPAKQR